MEIKLYEYEHCYWENGESIEWRGADWASHLMMMRVSKFVYLFARFTQNVLCSKIWRRNVNISNFMRTMNVRGREKRTNKQPRAHTSHGTNVWSFIALRTKNQWFRFGYCIECVVFPPQNNVSMVFKWISRSAFNTNTNQIIPLRCYYAICLRSAQKHIMQNAKCHISLLLCSNHFLFFSFLFFSVRLKMKTK